MSVENVHRCFCHGYTNYFVLTKDPCYENQRFFHLAGNTVSTIITSENHKSVFMN